MQNDPEVSTELVRQLYVYDPGSGVLRYRQSRGRMRAGYEVGSVKPSGYRILSINGKFFQGARVVWLYHHGSWPKGEIDHINHIRNDDRIQNLRDVPHQVNSHNLRATRKNSQTGITGIFINRRSGRYYATIYRDNKSIFLGSFKKFEDARKARENGKLTHHITA